MRQRREEDLFRVPVGLIAIIVGIMVLAAAIEQRPVGWDNLLIFVIGVGLFFLGLFILSEFPSFKKPPPTKPPE